MRTRLWRSLASQLVLVQLILIAAVLVAVSAVSVEQTRRQFQLDQGRRVLALAENLAATSLIRRGDTEIVNDATLPAATTQLQQTTGAAPRADHRPDGQGAGRHRPDAAGRAGGVARARGGAAAVQQHDHRARRSQLPDRRRADPVQLGDRRTGPPARHRAGRRAQPDPGRRPGRGGAHLDHLPRGGHGARHRGLAAAGPLDQAADLRAGAGRDGRAGRAARGDLHRDRRGSDRAGRPAIG